jgi:hypothetical protein
MKVHANIEAGNAVTIKRRNYPPLVSLQNFQMAEQAGL